MSEKKTITRLKSEWVWKMCLSVKFKNLKIITGTFILESDVKSDLKIFIKEDI